VEEEQSQGPVNQGSPGKMLLKWDGGGGRGSWCNWV